MNIEFNPTQWMQILLLHQTISFVTVMLVGFAFAFLGYRLFLAGFDKESGELKVGWSSFKLLLRKAAPGTFFALFGTGIIIALFVAGAYDARKAAADSFNEQKEQLLQRIQERQQRYAEITETLEATALIERVLDGQTVTDAQKRMITKWLYEVSMLALKDPNTEQ